MLSSELYHIIFGMFVKINLSIQAYGVSLLNEERCETCGGGKRDAPGDDREVVDAGTRGGPDFHWSSPAKG